MQRLLLVLCTVCTVLLFGGCMPGRSEGVPSSEEAASDAMQTTVVDGREYYLVETEGELLSIGKAHPLSGSYRLANDITLTGEWRPIGDEDSPFTGVFDGSGYTIYELTVTKKDGGMGFFGASEGAVIRNLVLENAHILEGGHINVGAGFAIVGHAVDTEITNCSINQGK